MALLEDVKKSPKRVTGWQRPSSGQIARLLRRSKRGMFRFRDDGKIPNHPRWPVIVFWSAVQLPRTLDPAAVLEDLFESNGWGDSWRNGIYDYLHYHSRIHEVLGIARGNAKVRLGGGRAALSISVPATWVFFRRGPGLSGSLPAKISWWLGPIRHPANMTSAGLTSSSTNEASNQWRRSSAPARTRYSALRARCSNHGRRRARYSLQAAVLVSNRGRAGPPSPFQII